MSWRIVHLNEFDKMSLKLNNILIRKEEDIFSINIGEIKQILISENNASITTRVISYLMKSGISVIFCDNNKMPVGEIVTLNKHSRMTKNIIFQSNWLDLELDILWKEIIYQKIKSQIDVMKKYNKLEKLDKMDNYLQSVKPGDPLNREGQAAKIYFKEVFGKGFIRFNDDIYNNSLNFTYQIVRSFISQKIIAYGYIGNLGIHHIGEYNNFNLSDDLIEVYRAIIDDYVINILSVYTKDYLTPEIKIKFSEVLNHNVIIDNKIFKLSDSFELYFNSIIKLLKTGEKELIFPNIYNEETSK